MKKAVTAYMPTDYISTNGYEYVLKSKLEAHKEIISELIVTLAQIRTISEVNQVISLSSKEVHFAYSNIANEALQKAREKMEGLR